IREIENSRQKTVTFARRRAGLIKKAHELSILCGVKVAILMFDSKHASHVYSSSDTPDDLFARYLNKQFLTNESRKRKDQQSGGAVGAEGTYGFDDTGSFIRRRLAVVNQYRVTSDGPSSENLHVKYTKQYHNPGAANRLSSSSTIAPNQHLGQGGMLGSAEPTMYGADVAPIDVDLQQQQQQQQQNRNLALPARSISLMRRGENHTPSVTLSSDIGSSPESSFAQLFHTHPGRAPPAFVDDHSTANAADNIVLTARDLSSLSLLSNKRMHPAAAGASPMPTVSSFNDACNGYHPGNFQPVVSAQKGAASSTLDANCIGGLFGMGDGRRQDANVEEPCAKRPKSQSFATDSDEKCMLNQGLVEQFLANTDVAHLLQTSWHGASKLSLSTNASGPEAQSPNQDDDDDDSENETDGADEDDSDDLDDDDDDDGDDDEEEGAESEDSSHSENDQDQQISAKKDVQTTGQIAKTVDITGGLINRLGLPQGLPNGLQGSGSTAPTNDCFQFYSPEGLPAFAQPQPPPVSALMPPGQQQYSFAGMPHVPAPFELANMMNSRTNPMLLFGQGEGEGAHQSYRLHPDTAYAINDKVF
ncbi:hypothetical protein GGI23_001419, partial [Coemansia sp. RSA 2559]